MNNPSASFCPQQLRMFDLNGDGKLGLSEMSRYVPALTPLTDTFNKTPAGHSRASVPVCKILQWEK